MRSAMGSNDVGLPLACAKCGETWSEGEWPELPMLGRYDAGRDGWLELRTCVCGSALALTLASAATAPSDVAT